MSIDTLPALHLVQQLLGDVVSALDGVDDPPLWSLGDGEVDALLVGIERTVSRLRARSLGLLAEATRRNRAGAAGATSHTAWAADLLGVTHAEAARLLASARTLDTAATDPVTAGMAHDARDGSAGVAQAVVAASAVAALSAEVSRDARTDAVAVMREYAPVLDPARLARVGERLVAVVDPERGDALLAAQLAAEERRAREHRSLTVSAAIGGIVRGRFVLPAVDAAVVTSALRPLAAPRPLLTDESAGDRSAAPHGGADPWSGAAGATADAAARDPRTHPQRMADALVELANRALTASELPTTGGERPQLVVTVPLARLREAAGAGETLDGTPVAPSVLRRVACDAGVLPAVLGGASQPLDIGRETRTVPTGLRRALAVRDPGCAFPGCDRPPGWCDAHHIRHWADGGSTALGNLVLLCGHHHRTVHATPWSVTVDASGHPVWRPPPWLAPPGTVLPARPRLPGG